MAESKGGTNYLVSFNPSTLAAIQDRTLVRIFYDALYPRLMYRGEAGAEKWMTQLGNSQSFTRAGLMKPITRPVDQNKEPTPGQWDSEQWEVTAQQWGGTIDTHMPTSGLALSSTYLRSMHQLGLQAGQSLNRVVRDKLYNAYLGGNTNVSATTGAGTTVPVVSLAGFTRRLLNGRPLPIATNNKLPVLITHAGGTITYNAVGFTPDITGDEIHSGTLTLETAHAGVTIRDPVLAANRSRPVNSGGSATIDNISAFDQFTMADIRLAIAQLQVDNAPVHDDGLWHCHLDPISVSQVFGDNEFQRLNQSIPDYVHYREFTLAVLLGCAFYRNTEAPLPATVDNDRETGFTFAPETANASGVVIHRPLFTAGGAIEEKYIDESAYISEAGLNGKVGEFAVTNNSMQIMLERIRLILRAPQDRFQQMTSSSWSFSGDWGMPTDAGSKTSGADFKRAVVCQHG